MIGKYALALYFTFAATASAYGSCRIAGGDAFWVYYLTQILFFGAEFTQVYAKAHGRKIMPTANADPDHRRDFRARAQAGIPHRRRQTKAADVLLHQALRVAPGDRR